LLSLLHSITFPPHKSCKQQQQQQQQHRKGEALSFILKHQLSTSLHMLVTVVQWLLACNPLLACRMPHHTAISTGCWLLDTSLPRAAHPMQDALVMEVLHGHGNFQSCQANGAQVCSARQHAVAGPEPAAYDAILLRQHSTGE
jgi:hypothetical protein